MTLGGCGWKELACSTFLPRCSPREPFWKGYPPVLNGGPSLPFPIEIILVYLDFCLAHWL